MIQSGVGIWKGMCLSPSDVGQDIWTRTDKKVEKSLNFALTNQRLSGKISLALNRDT